MRGFAIVVLALLVGACATPKVEDEEPPRGGSRLATEIRTPGAWAFAYDAERKTATAVLQGPTGLVVRITCEAPAGDVIITDWAFTQTRQGDAPATLVIGPLFRQTLGRVAGTGDNRQALTAAFSPDDPVFSGLANPNVEVRLNADGYSHVFPTGGAARLAEVASACRPSA